MSGRIYYPDVASYQAGINLSGWLAVMIKATEGTGYLNPAYHAQVAEATHRGAKTGAYHFLHAGSAAAQAEYCFSVAGRGTPLMIDLEPEPAIGSQPSITDAEQFCDRYRQLGGTVHLVYLPEWYWKQLGEPSLAGLASRSLHLVTSVYSGDPESDSGPGWATYGGMPRVCTWQYTSTGTVNGMTGVDINCFRGSGSSDVTTTLAELWSLWTTGSLTAPAADPASQTAPIQEDDVTYSGQIKPGEKRGVPVVKGTTNRLCLYADFTDPASPLVVRVAVDSEAKHYSQITTVSLGDSQPHYVLFTEADVIAVSFQREDTDPAREVGYFITG